LTSKWKDLRGVEIVSMGVSSVKASEEDEAMIKELQRSAVYRNANMAAAKMVDAQAEAMKAAASNAGGAMMGFMGMNMAQQAGGLNANQLFQMGAQQAMQPEVRQAEGWLCSCGHTATGKFCPECGAKKPASSGWTCACGSVNKGKFCPECGARKPAGAVQYKCDKCGWEPEKGAQPPRFCPECGDRFDDDDII
jgi:membrane protease subunit (stomatin/prohibitin family)